MSDFKEATNCRVPRHQARRAATAITEADAAHNEALGRISQINFDAIHGSYFANPRVEA